MESVIPRRGGNDAVQENRSRRDRHGPARKNRAVLYRCPGIHRLRDRIERSGLGVPIDLVYLDLGGTVVELISYEGAAVDPAPQNEHLGYRMIALEVDDMQKAADYLRTKGVDIVWGPRVRETYTRAETTPAGRRRMNRR